MVPQNGGLDSARPCPFPGPAPPPRRILLSSSPLTLAMRIMRLATSRSPWWFWPISAMMKHGCCPPTSARDTAPAPAAWRRLALLNRPPPPTSGLFGNWPSRVYTSAPPRQLRLVSPGPQRSQSPGPTLLPTANQGRGQNLPPGGRCSGEGKPGGCWELGVKPGARKLGPKA